MSATQPPTTLNRESIELLQKLLEAPPSSLELLSVQLATEPSESPASLASRAIDTIHSWVTSDKIAFIQGHPRIGEQSNLSAMSAAEQAKHATPQVILERLAVLNEEYERRLTGLRYITFVAGRTRAQIVEEMEDSMDIPRDRSPASGDGPSPLGPGDELWESELSRAIDDIGRIAQDRVKKL